MQSVYDICRKHEPLAIPVSANKLSSGIASNDLELRQIFRAGKKSTHREDLHK